MIVCVSVLFMCVYARACVEELWCTRGNRSVSVCNDWNEENEVRLSLRMHHPLAPIIHEQKREIRNAVVRDGASTGWPSQC